MSSFQNPSDDVVCICPKCGVEHTLHIFWTGSCTPRKFCPEHKKTIKSDELVYKLGFDDGRVHQRPVDQGDIGQG